MEIKIKKLNPEAIIPEKSHEDDFCYDCYAVSEEEIAPNIWRYGLGFALEIIRDDNCPPVEYRGEIMAVFYHVMPNMPRYKIGDKILQLHVNVTEPINFIEVDELTNTERGDGGFGSTDK